MFASIIVCNSNFIFQNFSLSTMDWYKTKWFWKKIFLQQLTLSYIQTTKVSRRLNVINATYVCITINAGDSNFIFILF